MGWSNGHVTGTNVTGHGNVLIWTDSSDSVVGNSNRVDFSQEVEVVGDYNQVGDSTTQTQLLVHIVGSNNTLRGGRNVTMAGNNDTINYGAANDTIHGSFDYLLFASDDSVTGSDDTLISTDHIVVYASHQLCTEGVCITKPTILPPSAFPAPPSPPPAPPRPVGVDGQLIQYEGYSFMRYFGACTNVGEGLNYDSQLFITTFDDCAAQCHATSWCSSIKYQKYSYYPDYSGCFLLHGHSTPTFTDTAATDYTDSEHYACGILCTNIVAAGNSVADGTCGNVVSVRSSCVGWDLCVVSFILRWLGLACGG